MSSGIEGINVDSNISSENDKQSTHSSFPNSEKLDEYPNNDGIQRIVTQLEKKSGALGPLEEPYDLTLVKSHPSITSKVNQNDPWGYHVDTDTNMRLVVFLDDDKENPKNWSKARKWLYTSLLGIVCFAVAFASALVTGDLTRPAETFTVSEEVIILASVTVFVIGFGIGPCVFAPFSEELGRKPIYVVTLLVAVIFIIPCALARNIGMLLVCRLIDGIAFSAPMCLIGGSLADLWEASERGVAMSVFSAAPFLGPVVGPIFGGIICDYTSTWRWIYWVLLIFTGIVYVIFVLVVPETHAGTLLKRRAKKLRKLTGDEKYKCIAELKVRNMKEVVQTSLFRPFILLSELIVFLITLYMSVVYGLLYMFFFAIPIVYMEDKGWSASKTGIMFIPIGVGVIISVLAAPFFNRDYNRRAKAYVDRGELPPPELRLIPMMISCWFVPAGLFSFAWSSYSWISWAGPCFSGLLVGFGFCCLYNPANNYIVDSYQHYAASALAAKTLVRSIYGGCVPLFTIQMYHKLNAQWASTLMAFISLACCLIPYMFYFYGAKVRSFSKYAYSPGM